MACGCKKTTLLTCIAFLAVVLAIGVVVSCGKAGDPDSDSNSGRDSAVFSEEPVDVSLSDVSMELGYRVTRPVKAVGGKEIRWFSSDEGVATVDSEGNVTGVEPGECVITAVNEFGRSAQCGVAVKKVCYLSFDDGPHYTVYGILDVLKEYDVKATFFLVNTVNIESVKRMAEEGHALALHTNVNSTKICYKTMYSYYEGLDILNDKLEELVGQRSDLIRFPGGTDNRVCNALTMRRIVSGADDMGYRVFDWTASAQDAAWGTDAASSYKNVCATCGDTEEIVLMHDLPFTAEALKKIIPTLRKRGYTFETLDHYPDRDYRQQCRYSWGKKDFPANSVSIRKKSAELKVGSKMLLSASMVPAYSTDYILWQSSDDKIASVTKGGLVKGIAEGEAIITARTSSGQTASCTVKVIPKQNAGA